MFICNILYFAKYFAKYSKSFDLTFLKVISLFLIAIVFKNVTEFFMWKLNIVSWRINFVAILGWNRWSFRLVEICLKFRTNLWSKLHNFIYFRKQPEIVGVQYSCSKSILKIIEKYLRISIVIRNKPYFLFFISYFLFLIFYFLWLWNKVKLYKTFHLWWRKFHNKNNIQWCDLFRLTELL